MKKDRFIITISDINSSSSFNLHKVIKKIILWIVLIMFFIISVSFFTISQLSENVNKLSKDKDTLFKANSVYSQKIKEKRPRRGSPGFPRLLASLFKHISGVFFDIWVSRRGRWGGSSWVEVVVFWGK